MSVHVGKAHIHCILRMALGYIAIMVAVLSATDSRAELNACMRAVCIFLYLMKEAHLGRNCSRAVMQFHQ